MSQHNGIFDIKTSEAFFHSIKTSFDKYKKSKEKNIESLLYIIMGLNHLREWIAPGYNHEDPVAIMRKAFYNSIWSENSFQIIRCLCNRSKHLNETERNTSASHNRPFDEWTDINSVRDFDRGPATDYFVDDKNIIEVVDAVVKFYETNWFDNHQ